MAGDGWWQLVVLGLASFGNVLFHILLGRRNLGSSVVLGLLSGYAFGLGVLVVSALFIATLPTLVVAFLTYSALSYCYFHFVHLGHTSVRLRVLRELAGAPDGLPAAALVERYSGRHIVTGRLERMVETGQIVVRANRYYTGKPRMLYVARIFSVLKRIVLGRKNLHEIHR